MRSTGKKWSFGPTKQLEGRREGGGTRNAIKKKNSALHLQELWWKSVSDNVPSLIMVVMITSCSSSIKRKCIGPFGINFKEDSIQELK